MSEFYAELRKRANELGIEEALVKVTFISGIVREAQKHCVLEKAETIDDYLRAAREFEKVARLSSHTDSMTISSPNEGKVQDSEQVKLDTVLELLSKQMAELARDYMPRDGNSNNESESGNRRQTLLPDLRILRNSGTLDNCVHKKGNFNKIKSVRR